MPFKRLWPIPLAIIFALTVFWQIPLKGLVPFPGNLLAGRLFPFNAQTWEGYPTGVPYKEFIAADAVRQTYPFRFLAISQLKQGQIPWWNPYSFSGSPLLANLQSAPFYPLNLLYFFLPFSLTWYLQVLLQPILAFIFTYLFVRSLKLSRSSSILAATSFAFCGYQTVWLELNTVGHAALWLPLILFSLKNLSQVKSRGVKFKFSLLLTFAYTASFFAGHLQTSFMVIIFSLAYAFHLKKPNLADFDQLKSVFVPLVISLALFSTQLIPSLELFSHSPRQGTDTTIFSQFLLPFSHLVTFIAPDFFGNPATNNYWGEDYGEFMAYFGVVALFFALIAIFNRPKGYKFFLAAFLLSLFFALDQPLAHLPRLLHLPVFQSSAPSRWLFITQFSGTILAAFGLDLWLKKPKKALRPIIFLISLYVLAWLTAILSWLFASNPVDQAQWRVSVRNLILPSGLFSGLILLTLLTVKKLSVVNRRLQSSILIYFALIEFTYFTNKYLPFSEPEFSFAPNPVFTYLQKNIGNSRFFGLESASVMSNIWLPYELYSPEGYDSLYLSRYGQLLAASGNQGKLAHKIPRSDANLPAQGLNRFNQSLLNLLSVSYLLNNSNTPEIADTQKFSMSDYQLIWHQANFQIYQNLHALPRAFLVSDYTIKSSDQEILDLLFNPEFHPDQTLILEDQPSPPIQTDLSPASNDSVIIESYNSTNIKLSVSSTKPQFLFLSDAFYPGWIAYLNNQPIPIYRAHYAFRAVPVPPGSYSLTFRYEPLSSLLNR